MARPQKGLRPLRIAGFSAEREPRLFQPELGLQSRHELQIRAARLSHQFDPGRLTIRESDSVRIALPMNTDIRRALTSPFPDLEKYCALVATKPDSLVWLRSENKSAFFKCFVNSL
ncbi:MAG: hypothetical protein WDM86_02800 [Rhizomicrobium sp.]